MAAHCQHDMRPIHLTIRIQYLLISYFHLKCAFELPSVRHLHEDFDGVW